MRYVSFLSILGLMAGAAFVYAAEETLKPAADSPLWEGRPTANYGSQQYGYWGWYNGCQRTLCSYDCTKISGTVTGAKLSFQMYTIYSGTGKMWACKVLASWQEYTVTWATQPKHDDAVASRLLDIDFVTGTGPHTKDCTAAAVAIIQGWVDTPATNYGLILKKNPESGILPRCYPYMKESGQQPVNLIVTYTPSAVAPASLGKIKTLFK